MSGVERNKYCEKVGEGVYCRRERDAARDCLCRACNAIGRGEEAVTAVISGNDEAVTIQERSI